MLSSAKLLPVCHTQRTAIDNRNRTVSWTLTRWRDQHTSDKIANYSIYWPERMKGWVGLVGWRIADDLPTYARSPVSYKSSMGQGQFAGWTWRPAFYHCATQPTMWSFKNEKFTSIRWRGYHVDIDNTFTLHQRCPTLPVLVAGQGRCCSGFPILYTLSTVW